METFISAPFGNYIKPSHCIPVIGTYTLKPRGNRLVAIAKTLRYNKQLEGWTNRLGLPNPGLDVALKKIQPSKGEILSVAQVEKDDFVLINSRIWSLQSLEVNLSCPNISEVGSWKDAKIFFRVPRDYCIAKVSPLISIEEIGYLMELGFTQFHFSNTLPVVSGGLSGPTLRPYVLRLIETTRKIFGDDIEIIAGGGIQHIGHVTEYINVGANHVSLGSIFFNPLKAWKLLRALK